VRFWCIRRIGQIVVAMLAGVCSMQSWNSCTTAVATERGTGLATERSANFSDEVTEGRSSVSLMRKKNALNEKVALV